MTIYTGDILLKVLDDIDGGNLDIEFVNGNPVMTNGLETLSIMASLGQDFFGNDLVKTEAEKMQSTFPDVIERAVVSDETKKNGTKALEKANAFIVSENIAKSVTVTGTIENAYTIIWLVEIEALTDETLKYYINWAEGSLTVGLVSG